MSAHTTICGYLSSVSRERRTALARRSIYFRPREICSVNLRRSLAFSLRRCPSLTQARVPATEGLYRQRLHARSMRTVDTERSAHPASVLPTNALSLTAEVRLARNLFLAGRRDYRGPDCLGAWFSCKRVIACPAVVVGSGRGFNGFRERNILHAVGKNLERVPTQGESAVLFGKRNLFRSDKDHF